MIERLAPAKINLALEILGKRNDGYHEIRSLMQTVNLCDVLTFETAEGLFFECTAPDLQNADNLVLKTAGLLKNVYDCDKGARIVLYKRIPWGVGFGGGSSDAAATLLALNELWELGCETSELVLLAARMGSDVPFFMYGGGALIGGKGEKVEPVSLAAGWFVLLVPPLPKMPSKTKHLYSLLDNRHYTQGLFVTEVKKALSSQDTFNPSLLYNVFDSVALDAFHDLDEWWRRFEEAGAANIHLAGSGPALFSPVDNEAKAEAISGMLCQQDLEAYAVSTYVNI